MFKVKAVRPEWVTLIASAFFLAGFNSVLWQHLFEITAADEELDVVIAQLVVGWVGLQGLRHARQQLLKTAQKALGNDGVVTEKERQSEPPVSATSSP